MADLRGARDGRRTCGRAVRYSSGAAGACRRPGGVSLIVGGSYLNVVGCVPLQPVMVVLVLVTFCGPAVYVATPCFLYCRS